MQSWENATPSLGEGRDVLEDIISESRPTKSDSVITTGESQA